MSGELQPTVRYCLPGGLHGVGLSWLFSPPGRLAASALPTSSAFSPPLISYRPRNGQSRPLGDGAAETHTHKTTVRYLFRSSVRSAGRWERCRSREPSVEDDDFCGRRNVLTAIQRNFAYSTFSPHRFASKDNYIYIYMCVCTRTEDGRDGEKLLRPGVMCRNGVNFGTDCVCVIARADDIIRRAVCGRHAKRR